MADPAFSDTDLLSIYKQGTDADLAKLTPAEQTRLVTLTAPAPSPSWGDRWQQFKDWVTEPVDKNKIMGGLQGMMEPLAHPQTGQDFGHLLLAGAPSGFLSGSDARGAIQGGRAVAADLAKIPRPSLPSPGGLVEAGKVIASDIPIVRKIQPAVRVYKAYQRGAATEAAAAPVPSPGVLSTGAAPAGPGVLQTTPGAALAAPSGAVLDDAALLAQKSARNVLRRQVGGFIGQASGGDPEMAAHLQQYSNALIEKSLTAGEQPNPATIWPAVKGEAAGYRASKTIDLPTAMMGSTPSPAGVGKAVQTLGPNQVKANLNKLGEEPMWQAWSKMTPGRKD